MEASGNDFIVIDNRKRVVRDAAAFARSACQPHTGIGANGILLIEQSRKSDFLMRIINSDGSEAQACGNGFRCVGLYANRVLDFPNSMVFETLSGKVSAKVTKNSIRVNMIDPHGWKEEIKLSLQTAKGHRTLRGAFINTGVPHVVFFVENLAQIQVEELGILIRSHQYFKPQGTNVNFVEVTGGSSIEVRTYERGVEGETLACGTGSVASAIAAYLTGRARHPVQVETKGGDLLTVSFQVDGKKISQVHLEGDAHFVFEGIIPSRLSITKLA